MGRRRRQGLEACHTGSGSSRVLKPSERREALRRLRRGVGARPGPVLASQTPFGLSAISEAPTFRCLYPGGSSVVVGSRRRAPPPPGACAILENESESEF